jgi:hypothetical protein
MGVIVETGTWSGLLDELQDAVGGLSRHLEDRDPSVRMLASERHSIERALDRHVAASDAIARFTEGILSRSAPRPRR